MSEGKGEACSDKIPIYIHLDSDGCHYLYDQYANFDQTGASKGCRLGLKWYWWGWEGLGMVPADGHAQGVEVVSLTLKGAVIRLAPISDRPR